jgi:hypothetical protein
VTDTPAPADDRSRLEKLLGDTEPVRRALYPVVVAVVALLVAYGLLDAETVPLWLALAVAVLGTGGIEGARRVAWAPATVATFGAEWRAALEDEYARGVTAGLQRTPEIVAAEILDDEPGEHAVDRVRVDDAAVQREAPTGILRAPSRATRCREVDDGRRCVLAREHAGPHMMTAG